MFWKIGKWIAMFLIVNFLWFVFILIFLSIPFEFELDTNMNFLIATECGALTLTGLTAWINPKKLFYERA